MNDLLGTKFAVASLKNSPEETESETLRSAGLSTAAGRSPRVAEFRPRLETPLVKPGDILAVEAEGNYVLLRRPTDSYLLRESISTMAEKLQAYGFVRIHRSVLVNATCVEEIHPGTTGEYVLRITGGREYMVSRTYKNNLKSLAHSWIGTDSFENE
jgi:DNA-binding LytR/AlgR family response regulator